MRRGRRTTRWRSCSASGIRAARSIDRLARDGNDRAVALPTTRLTHADRNAPELKGDLDFSFSGLKTAVLRYVREKGGDGSRRRRFLRKAKLPTSAPVFSASSSPCSSIDCSTRRAGIRRESIGIAGGVSANSRLRAELQEHGRLREMPTFLPSLALSTDNAAMIAAAGPAQVSRRRHARRPISTRTHRCALNLVIWSSGYLVID